MVGDSDDEGNEGQQVAPYPVLSPALNNVYNVLCLKHNDVRFDNEGQQVALHTLLTSSPPPPGPSLASLAFSIRLPH